MPNFSGIWSITQQMQAKGASTWPTVPGAPTIGTATAGSSLCASVTFTAPSCTGYPAGVTGYRVVSTPGCLTATGSSSPIVVTGLTDATSYTFKAQATNTTGYGALSAASNSITASSAGSSAYTTAGTFTFVVPSGVTSVSAVVVGGGGGGGFGSGGSAGGQSYFIATCGARFVRAPGGAGGTFGGSATVRTGAGTSAGTGSGGGGFGGGSRKGTGCYCGSGNSGGGGAGGYQPCCSVAGCGQGASSFSAGASGAYGGGGGGGGYGNTCAVGGGGVGVLLGQGCSGAGGSSGSTWGKGGSGGCDAGPVGNRINGGLYGGGGAGTVYNPCLNAGGAGARGAVRIVWPGTVRSYPSTCVGSP